MTEAEIIAHLAMRADNVFFLIQWWISTCFAVIVASHLGTEHLTRGATILVILLFSLFSIQTLGSLLTQQTYIGAAYQDLEALAVTSELGQVAGVALQNSRSGVSPVAFRFILLFLSFASTVGFVIHRHLKYRKIS